MQSRSSGLCEGVRANSFGQRRPCKLVWARVSVQTRLGEGVLQTRSGELGEGVSVNSFGWVG